MKWLSVLALLLSAVLMTGIGGRMSFACDHSTQGTADGGESTDSADSNGSTGHSSAGSGAESGRSTKSSEKSSEGLHGSDGNDGINTTRHHRDMPTLCDYWRLPWCPEKEDNDGN